MTAPETLGLTPDEHDLLSEALHDLPQLLADADTMRGPRATPSGGTGPATPASRPPMGLDHLAAQQNILKAWLWVASEAAIAGATLPATTSALAALTNPHTRDWYEPHARARNEVLIPLRQARTLLRRITKPMRDPIYTCPQCGGPARRQTGDLPWIRCDDCHHDAHLPNVVTTATAVELLGVTDVQLRQWRSRGKIEPTNPGHKPALWNPADIIRLLQPDAREVA